jgi:hypothetical protein
VGSLEILGVLVLHDLLQHFHSFSLIGAQSLEVDLLENLFLNIMDILANGSLVNLGVFAFESVAEIVDEVEADELLLFGALVEIADVLVGHSSVFLIMHEYFFAELNVDLVVVKEIAGFFLNNFFEMIVVPHNIFLMQCSFLWSF